MSEENQEDSSQENPSVALTVQEDSARRGWRSVFGKAKREEVEAVDAVISEEFETIEPELWP